MSMDQDFQKALAKLKKRAAEVGPITIPPADGLAKKWISLTRALKIKIAERLGLAQLEERDLDECTYDRRVFLRVGGYNKEAALASEIEKAGSSKA